MRTAYRIEIACDQHEGEEFCVWLNARGHDAKIGNSTGSYVDGAWTSQDNEASEIMNRLWDAYCNQPADRREHLSKAGQLLYGSRWQSELARALDVNDRRVRQWMADERPIPPGIWADIAGLLRQRQQEWLELLREMEE